MPAIVNLRDMKALILKASLIALLSLISATVFNYLRPASLPWSWTPPPPVAEVIEELDAFQQLLLGAGMVLVDARPQLYHQISHIPGSVSLPLDQSTAETLATWSQSLPPEATIIIYCSDQHCSMADDLAQKLMPLGLTPLIFTPGFVAWEAAGLPLESAQPTSAREAP